MATSKAGPGVLLASVQVPALRAGQTDWKSISGQPNNSSDGLDSVIMTPNGPNSTQPATNIKWHGLTLAVSPGVLNSNNPNATWPDIQMWLTIDSNLLTKAFFMADLSQPRLMFPPRRLTAGRHYMKLGNSLYKAALLVNQGLTAAQAFGRGNWPLLYTGPKIADDVTFHFSSTSGFTTGTGATDTFAVPPTIELWGDAYDAAMWAQVVMAMGAWNGAINVTSQRRLRTGLPPYSALHQVPAGIADFRGDGFQQLPDGVKQTGGMKVYRYLTWAVNSNAFTGTDKYVLTNQIQGLGKPGQVPDNHDLGYKLANTQSAYVIDRFGRLPVAGSGYWGITSQGAPNAIDRWPYDTDYGQLDTQGDPHYWYGYNYPVNGKDEYEIMGPPADAAAGEGGIEVFAYENAAYYTAALGGQTVAANSEFTAVAGQFITS